MHIEKNICNNVVGTTLPIKKKLKDTKKTRVGMQEMRIRTNMWRKFVNGKYKKRSDNYTFKLEGNYGYLKRLQNVKFPDGYASNISRYVKMDSETFLICSFLKH